MMTYEIFKEVVTERFKDYLSQKYQDMDMLVNPVEKVNCTLDSISLVGGAEGRRISPAIYINEMYEQYMASNDLQGVLQDTAAKMEELMQEYSQVPHMDMENAKDNIIFQLVNTEQNREMLKNMPHREFQDLSIIYRLVVKVEAGGIHSAKVDNRLAERLGLSGEQLFNFAAENTRRILPPCVKSMNEVMREVFMESGMPAEIADMMIGEMPPELTMWVITNDSKINGAASMLYEDKLHTLAQHAGTDLYILPSSVHEVIAVSVSMGEPEELAQMVSEINMDHVALEERLSNQVYHYDKDLRKLTLATNTPNKRLDGIVADTLRNRIAEPPMIYETKQSR